MKKLKSINWRGIIKNKYLIIGIIVVAVLSFFILRSGDDMPTFEKGVVSRGDVSQEVSVTGKVSPITKADLAFDMSGSVSNIYVKVGDQVNKGQLLASISNQDAVASLSSAQAKLDDLIRPLRQEELAVEQARVLNAGQTLENTMKSSLNYVRDAYIKSQSAMVNYADTFFDNPQSANPTLNIPTSFNNKRTDIEYKKLISNLDLSDMGDVNFQSTSTEEIVTIINDFDKKMAKMKILLDDLSTIVNDLTPSSSGFSEATIESYVSSMNTAVSTFNLGVTSLTTAKTALEQAQSNYEEISSSFNLKVSGPSDESIRVQRATVDSLTATVNKGRIYASISGVVTKVIPEVGEYVRAGDNMVSILGSGGFKAEAYIPEADIAKISIGNIAEITLDAYGPYTDFEARITEIDQAETILEGVPTYKTTLVFTDEDFRIRSGMTANINIMTASRENTLYVPTRAVFDNDGARSVRIVNQDGKSFTVIPVEVGLRGSNGNTEILSGLKEGDEVVTYIK